MAEQILLGDLNHAELIKFGAKETDYEGRITQTLIIRVPPNQLKAAGIDINEVGVDDEGNKGGINYKLVTRPDFISEPYYTGTDRARVILTGLKFEETPLTDMFMKFQVTVDRLREQKTVLMAELELWKQENKKLRLENFSMLKAFNDAKTIAGASSDIGADEEAALGEATEDK